MGDANRRDATRRAPLGTRVVERILRRTFNLAGEVVADHARGDVAPSFEVRAIDPWEFRDWGIIPWATGTTVGAVAAEHSYLEVQQVPTFDVIVTRITMNQAGTVREMAATIGDVPNIAAGPRDSGFPVPFAQSITPVLFIVGATAVPGVFGGVILQNLAAAGEYPLPLIIRAGSPNVIVVNNDTVNQAFTASLAGFLVPTNMSLA